ncbi:MAG: chorismate mutase [Bdellovibrio sp.]|nr:chorismate mutase [Bdellovibrio sp.]
MKSIESLRQEIDQVHTELYALLERRRDLTLAIWKIKQDQGHPFHNAAREAQILESFVNLNSAKNDPAFDHLLEAVMNNILREYEKYLRSQFKPEESGKV